MSDEQEQNTEVIEPIDFSDVISETMQELAMTGQSLLSRANEEDRPVIERNLAIIAQMTLGPEEYSPEDVQMARETINDIGLRYAIEAHIEISNMMVRLAGRLATAAIAAALA